MRQTKRWLAHLLFKRPKVKNVILIGIDYPSFVLGKTLIESHKGIRVVAFIDEEPWTNKTQVHGVTVYYPSDLTALIEKHDVKFVVQIEGQQPELTSEVINAIQESKATLLDFHSKSTLEEQLNQLASKAKECII